jgi:hypothetical protein
MVGKWEYGCAIVADNGHLYRDSFSMTDVPETPTDKDGTEDRWAFLRLAGLQGWELVCSVRNPAGKENWIFKRKLEK